MKKILPFFVLGMIVFLGLVDVVTSINRYNIECSLSMYQPEFQVDVMGGIGFSFILTNVGNATFIGNISGNLSVDDCLILSGNTRTIGLSSYEIAMGKSITFRIIPVGLGSAVATSYFDIENVAVIESEAYGFLLLVLVFLK